MLSQQTKTPHPLRLILMGTGPFAVPAFEALVDAGHEIALVVTRPALQVRSRKGTPPTPVRAFAQRHGFALFDPESINTPESIERLRSEKASLLVVCDYGQILSSGALDVTPLGGINLHGSLLPAYRGAAPVQWAVLNGDAVAGVTVIHMTTRLDGGPILATAETPIEPTDTAGSLETRLSLLGVEPTLRSVEKLALWDGTASTGKPQDSTRVSRAPRLSKASGRIDWTKSAAEIDCHVRAMQPWPGAFTDYSPEDDRPAIRLAVRVVKKVEWPHSDNSTAGSLIRQPGRLIDDKRLLISTGPTENPGVICIERLQPAGRNEVSGDDFLRGHRLKAGVCFH